MLELERKLELLMRDSQAVEAENNRLKTRLRVLEAVLPVREQSASRAPNGEADTEAQGAVLANLLALAETGSVDGRSPSGCTGDPPSGPSRSCSQSQGHGGNDSVVNSAGGPFERAEARMNDAAFQATATSRQRDGGAQGERPGRSGSTSGESLGLHAMLASVELGAAQSDRPDVALAAGGAPVQRPPPRPLQPPQMQRLSVSTLSGGGQSGGGQSGGGGGTGTSGGSGLKRSDERWLEAWRVWIREAALLVAAYDVRPNEVYLKRIEDAFSRLKGAWVDAGARHSPLISNMQCVNHETGAQCEVPSDDFWRPVAAGLKLTPQQMTDCRAALQLYREKMQVVLAERRTLAAQLDSCMGLLAREEAGGAAAAAGARREQLMIEVDEVSAALASNVELEGKTTQLARDLLNSKLFTRLQCARISILSYPYFPDALAILMAAVGEAEPSAMDAPDAAAQSGPLAGANSGTGPSGLASPRGPPGQKRSG